MKSQLKELAILHFLNDGVRTSLIVLLPFIAHDLSISLSLAGILGSSQPILAALLALPAGYFVGKLGGFKIILSILLIYSLSTIGIAFAFNASSLLILYFLAALGFGMFHTVGFTLTAKVAEGSNVGRAMGDFTSIGEIGRVAIPPVVLFATSIIGWRITLSILGAVGCFVFMGSFLLVNTKDVFKLKIENANTQNHKDFLKDLYAIVRNKKTFYITLCAIFDSFASNPIYVYLPFLLVMKGMSPAELSLAMGVFFVGSLLGKSFLGRGVDQFGNTKVFIFSEFMMATSLIATAMSSNFVALLMLSTLLGVFTKGTSPVVQTMFSELTDKSHYHKIFAFSELVLAFSAVLTVTALGILADKSGLNIVFYISAVLAIIAIIPVYALQKIKAD